MKTLISFTVLLSVAVPAVAQQCASQRKLSVASHNGVVTQWKSCPNAQTTLHVSVNVPAKDIVDTAVSAGSFETLVAAVKAAGLVETLKGKGPFTVFAPTDEAFAKLPDGVVANLLKPENKDQLVSILTYHVVPGKVLANEVVKLDMVKTVNGKEATIAVTDGQAKINDAKIVATDIEASNGVVHVIDRIIMP
ncbi:MAG: fasciclin domain-containing protein [Pirellulaceae bacterium]